MGPESGYSNMYTTLEGEPILKLMDEDKSLSSESGVNLKLYSLLPEVGGFRASFLGRP